MKALTILQPYASLVAEQLKTIETRSWATKYRGPLAIHTGKSFYNGGINPSKHGITLPLHSMHLGYVIAIVDLVDCVKISGKVTIKLCGEDQLAFAVLDNGAKIEGNELAFGDYTYGRYAWILANVRRIEPVSAKGMQRIWEWEGEVKYA